MCVTKYVFVKFERVRFSLLKNHNDDFLDIFDCFELEFRSGAFVDPSWKDVEARSAVLLQWSSLLLYPLLCEGFPLRMSGIDNSYKIDGDVLLVIHASIPPGVELGPGPTLPRTPVRPFVGTLLHHRSVPQPAAAAAAI